MLKELKKLIKNALGLQKANTLQLRWTKKSENSWLGSHLIGDRIDPKPTRFSARIEQLATKTNEAGPQPLWKGYEGHNQGGASRMPEAVRTADVTGNFYSSLVEAFKPEVMVEFGTAFGVSGMYFLAGLESNNKGHLYTFDPNEVWRHLAVGCLEQISKRFTSTAGTFEENVGRVLLPEQRIDMAFIDAIHTKEFVMPQLDLVVERCSDHAIIILDDIGFSDSMRDCWQEVSQQPRFVSSVAVGARVGIVELRR